MFKDEFFLYTCSAKPMLSISSASSRMTYSMFVSFSFPEPSRSLMRPGVPIRMSIPDQSRQGRSRDHRCQLSYPHHGIHCKRQLHLLVVECQWLCFMLVQAATVSRTLADGLELTVVGDAAVHAERLEVPPEKLELTRHLRRDQR